MALRNLSVSMLSTVCVVKAGTFVVWQKHWRRVINYVSNSEMKQLLKNDETTTEIVRGYISYSRKVTYFYWSLVTATVLTLISTPLISFISSSINDDLAKNKLNINPEIISSWVPFDKTEGVGYWVLVLEHSFICCYGGGIVAYYDSNAVVLMSFFAGQLKLLKSNCKRLFEQGSNALITQEYINRIHECHVHHINLLKYSKILDSLLSPVLFLYVIICSLMICASAVQLTTEGTSRMQQVWIAEYLLALIAQLFLYCWHSNEVSIMSLGVDDGVYASAWWCQNVVLRRNVLLLIGKLRKKIVFTAGPFTTLSIPTFVAILKGSYSYYTLISKKQN